MRALFAIQLEQLEERLYAALHRAAIALRTAVSEGVVAPNPVVIEEIDGAVQRLRRAVRQLDAELVTITALQSPVATDLRRVMVMIELTRVGELIANQLELIAQQLSGLAADGDPPPISQKLSEMAVLASRLLDRAGRALKRRNEALARRLDHDDDLIDTRNRDVFKASLAPGLDRDERERAFRQVLIARSLERIGDNAVDIGEQVVFLVTAEVCEFSDASHPRAAA